MNWRVEKVIALMKANLRRELTLGEMAQAVNLSTTRLHHLFKAEMGGSPARYLKWLRMRRAQELLETTSLSVKEIMHLVGVKDDSHFVRDFEMACGLTPARYRAHYLSAKHNEENSEQTRKQNPPINDSIG